MSDNVVLPGTGATIASDEAVDTTLGTVQFQIIKLADGTLGSTNKAIVGSDGALKVDNSGVTQPVSLTSVPTHAVTQSGTWTVQPGNTANTTAWKVDGSSVTQPVSGTVTATISSTTNAGATAKTSDYDTGAGTDTVTMVGIALPASGGAVQGGTSANPIQVSLANTATNSTAVKVDASGTTVPVSGTFWQSTQPVSGTVTVQQSTAANLKVDLSGTAANTTAIKVDGSAVTQPVSLSSVPTHAVTQSGTWTVQPGNTANTTAWKVDGSSVTQPVSGTVTATLSSTTNAGATAKTSDYDTGAGTDTVTMVGLALPASGGAVSGGTSTNPIRTDPTGTTTQPISGTVTANAGTGTMAVSAASLPLPSGASTSAKQPALGTAGTASADVITVQGIASMTALKVDGSGVTQPVSGTFWQATQPVSAASLPLPSGAATSAKQPALGTAGTAASDVLTVQGIASMTALKVDGSAVTQPVSGTFWQATQPVSGTVTVQQSTASSLKVDLSGTAANATAIKVDGSAVNQPVTAAAATATTGTITTSASVVSASVAGYSHVGVSINGTYAGVTVAFEFSDDSGTTWYALQVTRSDSSIVESTSGSLTNTSRAWDCTVPSCTNFRVRATTYTSGTANVRIIPSAFPSVYNVAGNFRVTDSTAANFLPTMDAVARKGFVAVTDGTNTAAVKAASTAAVAADPAVVVSVSPNTPVVNGVGTANGWTPSSQTALSNTKTQVKSSAGLLGGYMFYNPNASVIYIQVWNVALASITVGTTAPTYVIPIPASSAANVLFTPGITHGTAICIAATTTATGSTAPTTALAGFFLFN